MDDSTDRADIAQEHEAHQLYWYSDASVNQIAEKLGVSKGRLYGFITPLPSGLACPECGSEMVYSNRTAREQGALTCTDCGYEEAEPSVGEDVREAAPYTGPERRRRKRLPGSAGRPAPQGLPMDVVVGGALVGVALGAAAAAYYFRRR